MRKNIFTKATMRRAAAFGLAGCMAAASLTGCGSSKTESTTAANAETKVEAEGESKAEAADGSDIHVGIIFTEAGLSGNSFNDLALEGVKKAADDYGITYDEVEPKSVSDEEIIQDEMASSGEYDLIICVGAEQVDALTNVATTYPDQKFALLDSCAYHAITSVVEGTYTGENQVLGLSDGGVDVTTEKSNIQVSDSIKEQLDDLKAKVISGEIEVPYELK